MSNKFIKIAGIVLLGIVFMLVGHEKIAQGAFSDPFVSRQLAPSPSNGKILQTDGTNSTWVTIGAAAGSLSDWQKETNFNALALTPTTTIPVWIKGALYASSTLTVSGTGTSTIANFGGTFDPTVYAGSDFGAQVNAAYDAVPDNSVLKPPAGTYPFSTMIDFGTNGKQVTLDCSNGVILKWTGTGTSTRIGSGVSLLYSQFYGVKNCDYRGPGGSSVAIELDGDHGAPGVTIEGNHITGFGLAIGTGADTWNILVQNNWIEYNTQAVKIQSANNSGENMRFINNVFAECLTVTKCFYSSTDGAASIELGFNSYDDAQLYFEDGNYNVSIFGGHAENVNSGVSGRYDFIVTSSGGFSAVKVDGLSFFNGATTSANAPTQFINNGASLVLSNVSVRTANVAAKPPVFMSNRGQGKVQNMGLEEIGGVGAAFTAFATTTGVTINVDSSLNNVAIGTTTRLLTDLLDVAGTGAMAALRIYNTTSNGTYSTINYNNAADKVFANHSWGIDSGITLGTQYQALAAPTNGLSVFGNVGIGTSTPISKLSVQAGAADTSTSIFTLASSTLTSTTTLFQVSNTGSTTASNGFNITSGCYAVNGNCLATGAGSFGTTSIDTSAKLAAIVADESGSGSLIFGTNSTLSSTTLTASTTMQDATSTTFWASIASSTNLFATNGRFSYSSTTGGGYFGGNVGIGTTSPSAPLEISGSGTQLQLTNGVGNTTFAQSTTDLTITPAGASGVVFAGTNGIRTNATTDNSDFAAFGVTGLNRTTAQLLLPGSAGIGIRSLFRGSTNYGITAGSNYSSINIGLSNITEAASGNHPILTQLGIRPLAVTAGSATVDNTATLYIEDSASTTVSAVGNYSLWIDNGISRFDDKVAIGTTSPFAKLSVHALAGDTNTTLFAVGSSTASATTTLFKVTNDGKVGIGTDNPQFTVDADGTVAGNNGYIEYNGRNRAADGWTAFNMGNDGTAFGGGIALAGSTNVNNPNGFVVGNFITGGGTQIWSNNQPNLYLTGANNLGFSTTTPMAKMAIHANAGETNKNLFAIASSTITASTTLFNVQNNGATTITGQTSIGNPVLTVTTQTNGLNDTAVVSLLGRAWVGYDGAKTNAVLQGVASKGVDINVNNNTFGQGTFASFTSGSRLGLSTTTPSAILSVQAKGGGTDLVLFNVGSSTQTATTSHFTIQNNGQIFAPNTVTASGAQTGAWCYNAAGELIRESAVCTVSARKFKRDILPLGSMLEKLKKMEFVSYFKKEPLDEEDSHEQMGVIADDAENIEPRLVTHDSEGEVHSFRYDQFTAMLGKSIQELNEKVDNIEIGKVKRSIELNWMWGAMGLLLFFLVLQQIQIGALKKRK